MPIGGRHISEDPTMSTLRKTKPLVESCCKCLSSRSFHTLPGFAAKIARAPRLVQKAKALNAQSSGTIRIKKPVDAEAALPTLDLLRSAHKAGAINLSPEQALGFLREYQERARRPHPGWERKLCDDHTISPSTLTMLARISNRSQTSASRYLGRKLMLSASLLGDKSATIQVIEAALVQSVLDIPEIAAPIQRLRSLVEQGHPDAMLLHGRVLLEQGEDSKALKWFHEAAEAGQAFEGLGEALTQEGKLLMKRRDKVGAVKLLRRAALELDEPVAYWLLSELQPKGSPEQELYLLKAASSGITEAAHGLGVVELRKLDNGLRQGLDAEVLKDFPGAQFSLQELGLATEWFKVAAAGGYGQSMLTLAMLYQANGQHEEGLKWLEMAHELSEPDIKRGVRSMRARWDDLEKLHLMKQA